MDPKASWSRGGEAIHRAQWHILNAKTRVMSGGPIGALQLVQEKLAVMLAGIATYRLRGGPPGGGRRHPG